MENGKKPDRRVVRTKKAIRNAFAELFAKMPFEEITVTDIARKADINRKTFYNYYSGVHQIAEEIENEITASLERSLQGVNILTDLDVTLTRLNAVITENYDFCVHIFTAPANMNHTVKFLSALTVKIRDYYAGNADIPAEALGLMTEYTTAGMLAVYRRWFITQNKRPLEELSKDLSAVMLNGINGFIK